MKNYVIYRPDGRIVQWGQCPDDLLLYQGWDGVAVMEGEGTAATHYVERGTDTVTLLPRPANPATLTGLTLESLPVPCTVEINGTAYACQEASATLAFPEPGSYAVTVSAWPCLDTHFEVTQ